MTLLQWCSPSFSVFCVLGTKLGREQFFAISSLPAGSNLFSELEDRLDRSTHLIVLASPESSRSHGMEWEAEYWFSKPRRGDVLIIVTSGDYSTWEEIRTHTLPPTVASRMESEPLWISISKRRPEILSNPDSIRVRRLLIEDLKQLLLTFNPGKEWGELVGEESSQRRRALTLLFAVVFIFASLAVVAWTQRNHAIQQQHVAEAASRSALAEKGVSDVRLVTQDFPTTALILAVEAVHVQLDAGERPLNTAKQLLWELLGKIGGRGIAGQPTEIVSASIDPQNRLLALAGEDQIVRIWSLNDGNLDRPVSAFHASAAIRGTAFVLGGLIVGCEDGSVTLVHRGSNPENWQTSSLIYKYASPVDVVASRASSNEFLTISSKGNGHIWTSGRLGRLTPHEIIVQPSTFPEVAFSGDGRWIAMSGEQTPYLWQVGDSGAVYSKSLPPIDRTGGHGWSVAFDPVSARLFSGNGDGTVSCWKLGAQLARDLTLNIGDHSAVYGTAVSPDGEWLVAASESRVRAWSLSSSDIQSSSVDLFNRDRVLEGERPPSNLSKEFWKAVFLYKSHWLIVSYANQLLAWKFTKGIPDKDPTIFKGDEGKINGIMPLEGGRLVTASNVARLWDLDYEDNKSSHGLLANVPAAGLAFTSDGSSLVGVSSGGSVSTYDLWNPGTWAKSQTLFHSVNAAAVTAATPDFSHIFVRLKGEKAEVKDYVRSADTTYRETSLKCDGSSSRSIEISPDGNRLLTYSEGRSLLLGTTCLWTISGATTTLTAILLKGQPAPSEVKFTQNGAYLALGNGAVRIFDTSHPDPQRYVKLFLRGEEVSAVAFSADGDEIAVGYASGLVALWKRWNSPGGPDSPVLLHGHVDKVRALAFSPDGRWLASAGYDEHLRLWNLKEKDPSQNAGEFSAHNHFILLLRFSTDSHLLFSGGLDGAFDIWTISADGRTEAPLSLKMPNATWYLDFQYNSSAQKLFVISTTGPETFGHLCDLNIDNWLNRSRETAGRNLSQSEWERYFPSQLYRKTFQQYVSGYEQRVFAR